LIEHTPVLLAECLEGLKVRPGGRWLDATLGLGGHSEAILGASAPDGRLTGIDRDGDALARARERLVPFGERTDLRHMPFSEAPRVLAEGSFDGVLADLGVSSMQLLTPDRGFSFMADGPLDMRMDPSSGISAAEYMRSVTPEELESLLREAGEERFASRLTALLKSKDDWSGTAELAQAVCRTVPRRGRTHPATRVFMALRLAVNREMGELNDFLAGVPALLVSGGRLAVISFHSTEDRIVKRFYQDREDMRRVTKSPVIPSWPERKKNPRSRSAKLRVFEKV
jgi:16S rRNA (cytosine1402-N4)-methyltransferase